MATDSYKGSHDRADPVVGGAVVDLSSTDAAMSNVTRAVWVGTSGDLKVDMIDGSTVVWPSLSVGWHPLRVTKIYKTGTTAAQIAVGW
jgi:hypothetical protein